MTSGLKIPEIETDRLRLRGWIEEDLNPFAAAFADPEFSKFIGGPLPRDKAWRAIATQIGHWLLRGYGFFAIELKATGQLAGWAGPWYPEGWPEGEIGWSVFPAHQGKGYATEAAAASLDYAYRTLNWTTAISLIDENNYASAGVAAKLGASREREQVTVTDFVADIWRHCSPDQYFGRTA